MPTVSAHKYIIVTIPASKYNKATVIVCKYSICTDIVTDTFWRPSCIDYIQYVYRNCGHIQVTYILRHSRTGTFLSYLYATFPILYPVSRNRNCKTDNAIYFYIYFCHFLCPRSMFFANNFFQWKLLSYFFRNFESSFQCAFFGTNIIEIECQVFEIWPSKVGRFHLYTTKSEFLCLHLYTTKSEFLCFHLCTTRSEFLCLHLYTTKSELLWFTLTHWNSIVSSRGCGGFPSKYKI